MFTFLLVQTESSIIGHTKYLENRKKKGDQTSPGSAL